MFKSKQSKRTSQLSKSTLKSSHIHSTHTTLRKSFATQQRAPPQSGQQTRQPQQPSQPPRQPQQPSQQQQQQQQQPSPIQPDPTRPTPQLTPEQKEQFEKADDDVIFKARASARVTSDVSVPIYLTQNHLMRHAVFFDVRSPDSPQGQAIYNSSTGSSPSFAFSLYPNPTNDERAYQDALEKDLVYPRYSYDTKLDGSLQHIRGAYYLPQYGGQHLLSQGRIETFKPIRLREELKYVIREPTPKTVDQQFKHRDRIEFDKDGRLIGLLPPTNKNMYYTAVEHNQIQDAKGELCLDYQIQHIFYHASNSIIVTPKEQNQRQRLEQIYDELIEKKREDLIDQLRELSIKTNIEILPDKTQSVKAVKEQLIADVAKKNELEDQIQELGGKPSTDTRYWDLSNQLFHITKAEIFDWLGYTSNNNKLCFNERYASFHGHDGTLVPMEYLAARALHEISAFTAQFAPKEPQIWADIRHESIAAQQEHIRQELLYEKATKFKAYKKYRTQQRRTKQNLRYEELVREQASKSMDLLEKDEERKKGKTKGLLSGLLDTKRAFNLREAQSKIPFPEDIEVSDDPDMIIDREFDVWDHESEITLNEDELKYLKQRTTPPPWHSTFQQIRRYEFRSLTPLAFKKPRGSFLKITPEKERIQLDFYARLLYDGFDYSTYHHVLTAAQHEFELMVSQLKSGLIKEYDLDLSKMVSFADICRDKPLEIEVWFELPPDKMDPIKERALKIASTDPRTRPTRGTRVWTGIVTIGQPGSFHFMDMTEDQMKRLFALRQGIKLDLM